jgi:hypothetical protein
MQFCYGVGSNFITGAPPEFEDLLTLQLCMNPKFNNPNCNISRQGFEQGDLPNQVRYDTSIHLQMMKLRPLLAAENFHNKLRILLEAVIGCQTSSATQSSHNYLQYECRAYHRIAAFNGIIEPQQDGLLHWHIMLYQSVLTLELLQKAAVAPVNVQTQIGQMLASLVRRQMMANVTQRHATHSRQEATGNERSTSTKVYRQQ